MADQPKIDIPADLTTPYAAPDGATIDQLQAIANEAQERGIALLSKDDYTEEDHKQAEWLAAVLETCVAQVTSLQQAETERRQAADELRNRLGKPNDGEGDDGDQGGDDTGNGGDDAKAPPSATQVEAVVAAAVPSTADVAKRVGKPNMSTRRGGNATLTAAADVPGFSAGSELTMKQLGEAWFSRSSAFAGLQGSKSGNYRANVARINIESPDAGLVASGSGDKIDITQQIDHAVDETRLPGGALTASAGWCAPSEPLYDLLNIMTAEGLISVPEVTVRRGGVQWATGPDFTAVWSGAGLFTQTEAQNIAGNTKSHANVPCPSPVSARMNVDGLFLTSDILGSQGWPEAQADFMQKAAIVFQHYVSAKTVADIVAGSDAVDLSQFGGTPQPPAYNALANVLGAIALQVEDMKYRGRLSRGQSVEVLLPFFARNIFRSDLWKRTGTVQDIAITDAQIDQLFTNIGVSPQYVYDWQDTVTDSTNPTSFGAAIGSVIKSWPQTFKVVIYPSGTWVRAIEPVIRLDAVYDSTLLATNQYVALFQEQGRLTMKRGFDSRIIKVASNPSGITAGSTDSQTRGSATVATPL